METINREDILRMIGLRDSAGLFSKVNSLMIDMYDENGKLAEYSTQIVQTEKNIMLLAQRVTDNETDIADLTVTAQQISATVEHQQDEIDTLDGTVSGHTTQIGQLQVTAQQIQASVSSLTDTVETQGDDISGLKTTTQTHTSQISSLQMTDTQIQASVSSLRTDVNTNTGNITRQSQQISTISQKADSIDARVQVVEGDYVKNAQISLMVTKNAQGYISNASIKADNILFTFTDVARFIAKQGSTTKEVMNINPNGDLWISGEYRGGTITDNVVVGTSGGEMEIYSDEVVTGSLKKSGLRGVVGSNTVLDLGFTRLNSELSPYFMMHGTAPFIAQPVTMTMHPYSMSIGIDRGNAIRLGIGGTGKIDIAGSSASAWPSRDEVGVGGVFVGNDEILRVRLS
jgi:hypothetical protein